MIWRAVATCIALACLVVPWSAAWAGKYVALLIGHTRHQGESLPDLPYLLLSPPMARPAALVTASISIGNAPQAPSPPVTDCDRLVAKSFDSDAVILPGVGFATINTVEAEQACASALKNYPNEKRFMFQLARALDAGKKYDEAMNWYVAAAEAGHADAISNIGVFFEDGNGVPRDYYRAMEQCRRRWQFDGVAARCSSPRQWERS